MRKLLLLVLVLFLALPANAVEWPQFHADERKTGTIVSDFAVPKGLWWSRSTNGSIEGSPVVSDGRVFVGSTDGKLYAFDAISGSLLWTFATGGAISTTPALSGGIIYVVNNDGKLFALDAISGNKRLSAGTGNPDPGATRSSPTIHEGRLYIGTEGGSIIAYNLQTLTKDWEFKLADEKNFTYDIDTQINDDGEVTGGTCSARFATKPIRSSPAVFDSTVYAGSDASAVIAIYEHGDTGVNAGKTYGVWESDSSDGDVDNLACPAKFPKAEEDVLADFAARYPLLGDVVRASPVVDSKNRLVIAASYDNTVRAFDVDSGEEVWEYRVTGTRGNSRVVGTPAVVNGKVYFGSYNGKLYNIETTTSDDVRLLWNFTAGDAIESSPVVSNNHVVFGANDETVYVLNAGNGREEWRYRVGDDVRSSPAIWTGTVQGTTITGGVMYVGVSSTPGLLYAFGGDKPPLPDLMVLNITTPTPFYEGKSGDLGIFVRNAGNNSSPDTDLKLFIDGVLVTRRFDVPALGPGESVRFNYTWTIPKGNHTLRAVVDPSGDSREFDRANNELIVNTPVAGKAPAPPPPSNNTGGNTSGPPAKKAPGPELALVAGVALLLAVAERRRRRG
jgi:outer membrane protein assembly factor BamB